MARITQNKMHSVKPFDFNILPSRQAHEFQPSKSQLNVSDLHNLFSFIWAKDPYNYDHPRYRIQVALVLLLYFHLGLHPRAALSEGLYYGDTKLLFTYHDNAMRVVLLICLKDRKRFPNSIQWAGYAPDICMPTSLTKGQENNDIGRRSI